MTTTQNLFGGRLKIRQKESGGYRFSIDALILAHHISSKEIQFGVDLGTGCGVIPLIVAYQNPLAHLCGIEIQKDLADLASRNVRLNQMENRVTILRGDMKDFQFHLKPGVADVVFSNPPYCKVQSGRLNPDAERAVARHEIKMSLSDLMSVAEKLLKPSGCFSVIHPAGRMVDLLTQMRTFRLEPKRLRVIHSKENSRAELVLAEGLKYGKPGLSVVPPLIVHETDGGFTEEAKEMIGE